MSRHLAPLILLLILGIAPLGADTVTTKGQLSVNGALTEMVNSNITLIARYDSGPKILSVKSETVEMIEFNDTTFNPGAPPEALGIGPPINPKSGVSQLPRKPGSEIVLRGGQHWPCKLKSIDKQYVHCFGNNGDYDRRVVVRILLDSE